MDNTDMKKIIERVKKLHAMAESAKAIGSVEEAEAFAIGVQKMLMEYKLEMSVLHEHDVTPFTIEVDESIVDWRDVKEVGYKRRRVGWLETLAYHVTHAYGCQFGIIRGTNLLIIVGEEADRKVAEFVLTTLARTAVELGRAATRKERYRQWKAGAVHNARGYAASWMVGFAQGVGVQLRDRLEAMRNESPGLALVLTKTNEAVEAYSQKRFKRSATQVKTNNRNLTGYLQGKEAGKNVQINTGAIGASRDATKAALTPAQKAITSGGK